MKVHIPSFQISLKVLLCTFFILYSGAFSQENVGIGTSTPDNSAVLELSTQLLSSPKGFLVPRITTTLRDGITTPANGLLIYNTTTNRFEYNTGTSVSPSWVSLVSGAAGGVTSVGLSLPSIFTVSGSPVTSSGTLSATLATQAQNTVFAGPTSGADAVPSFRVLDALDIPNLDAAKLTTGTLPIARGGTNSTATPTAGGVPYGTGTAYAFTVPGTSGQVLTSNGAGMPTWTTPSSAATGFNVITSGTNTGAAMIVGTGASLTFAGTGTITANQYTGSASTTTAVDLATTEVAGILPIANGGTNSSATPTAGAVVYGTGTAQAYSAAGTSGQLLSSNGAAAPSFRALTAADIASGTLPIARGGTNSATALNNNRIMVSSGSAIVEAAALTNGQLLIGSTGAAPVAANIAGTTNQLDVTNGAGSIGLKISDNSVLPGTGSVTVPSGTTVNRPASPVNGMMRYNTTTGKFEFYQGSTWVNPLGASLSGGGTVNYLPKYTESTTLGNSIVFANDTAVAIGTITPQGKSILDLTSSTKGFLPPRMKRVDRTAIAPPVAAAGLTIYMTDTVTTGGVTELPGMYYWDGYQWTRMVGAGAAGSLQVFNKLSNTTATSIGTTIVDSNLRVPLAANETWAVDGVLHFTNTSNNANIDIGFTVPGSSTMKVGYHINENGNMSAGILTFTTPITWARSGVAGNSIAVMLFKAVITTGATSGNFQLQWRGDSGMRLESNSFLTATKR